jgi:thiol-disulfide isomerase/thioredoxin
MNLKIFFFPIIIIGVSFTSCNGNTINKSEITSTQNSINITQTDSLTLKIKKSSSLDLPELSFFDSLGNIIQYRFHNDTILKISLRKWTILTISSQQSSEQILVYPGDDFSFELKNNKWTISNIESLKLSRFRSATEFITLFKDIYSNDNLTLENAIANAYQKKSFGLNSYTLSLNKSLNLNDRKNRVAQIIVLKEKKFHDELYLLDSLYKAGLVDHLYYEWQKNKAKTNFLSTQFQFLNDIGIDFTEYANKYNFQDDTLLLKGYNDYRAFVQNVVIQKIILKNNFISKGKGQFGLDYIKAFDSAGNFLNSKTLAYSLFHLLREIKNHESTYIFKQYLEKFMNNVKDTLYLNYVKENIAWDLDLSVDKDFIVNLGKQKVPFEEALKMHAGKLIYIDFWASWCIPCRTAMPSSKKLRGLFKNDKIVFIYVSIDEDFQRWRNASASEDLFEYNYSYLLYNPKNSKLLKQLSITSIPRYLLISQNGKIIHSNAPGPDSKDLLALIQNSLTR